MTTQAELESRAAQLRAQVNAPSERERAAAELQQIEQQLAEQREAVGRAAGQDRLLGISRADGSLASELPDDERRIQQLREALDAAITRLNDRVAKRALLRAEATALRDRFGLAGPALRGLGDVRPLRPQIEQDAHGMRERRTYEEIRGTAAFEIIMAAGLKPWPPLTEKQQAIVAARTAARERERRALPGLAAEARALASLPPGLGVHRG